MDLGCLTLTHFVHSEKLVQDGRRTLLNQGQVEIKWQKTDSEGSTIKEHGILAAIYEKALLSDPKALHALMREDNPNATISMAEDTMSAYGTVDRTVKELADIQKLSGDKAKPVTDVEVLYHVKLALSGKN